LQFDNSFSFIFSPRPGTPAANLHDDTPHAVKLAPPAGGAGRDQRQHPPHSAPNRLGTVQRILVEGTSRKDAMRASWPGRTECNRVVNFRATHGWWGRWWT
jgi:tRNA-2-methylthio-N6-dimethylallyladenosine synthase